MKKSLYIYYKVPIANRSHTLSSLKAMMHQLKLMHSGLEIQVMQRPEVSERDEETWMEVYTSPEGVSEVQIEYIQSCARNFNMPILRKTEMFIPLLKE